jgi:hypothetical protein
VVVDKFLAAPSWLVNFVTSLCSGRSAFLSSYALWIHLHFWPMDLLENSMDMKPATNRIHPLMAGAAVSVIVVSLTGIAALTGVLPSLHANAVQPVPVALQAPAATLVAAPFVPVVQQAANAPARQDDTEKPMARPKPIVHQHQRAPAPRSAQYFQAPPYQAPVAAQQAPPPAAAPNSAIGIGVGAVVGGLLGNQVGGGNGKTLATIAGAVGGGYLGNEIARRNP